MTSSSITPLLVYASATPQSLCYAVKGVAGNRERRTWVAKPYNYFDPDRTPWWLVPSPVWPAYAFGKYSFRWAGDQSGVILAGFQVEKGVDPAVAAVFRSAAARRFITQDDWEWFRFVRSVERGEFDDALAQAEHSVQSEVYIQVAMGIANDPNSFDPDGPAFPRAVRAYLWMPVVRSLRLTHFEGADELAVGMKNVRSLREMLHEIAVTENHEWLWINLMVAVRLYPSSDPAALTQHQLWTRFLSYFRPWVDGG